MADDLEALLELSKLSNVEIPQKAVHYLYFPLKSAAKQVVEKLKELGFSTDDRLGADDVNWLVLATAVEIPTIDYVTRIRQQMESIALALNGEYDG